MMSSRPNGPEFTRKCLIVGGSGFIGSHLAERLSERRAAVRVLGRSRARFLNNIPPHSHVEFRCGSVENPRDVEAALDGVDSVVYLAHATVPATSMHNLGADIENSVLPLISLLEAVSRRPEIRRFVFLSSGGTVYGNTARHAPIAEEHPTLPISGHGLTKLVSEHYVRLCLSSTATQSWIIRASNVYGPRQNLSQPQGAVGIFLQSLLQHRPITLYGDGSIVRDFVFVTDVVDALTSCLTTPLADEPPVRTWNVGSGRATSLAELVDLVQRVTGRSLRIERRPLRDFDCLYNVLDTTAIRRNLPWEPTVPLVEGLERTWAWIQDSQHDGTRREDYSRAAAA